MVVGVSAELIPIDCEPLGQDIDELLNYLRDLHAAGEISSLATVIVFRDGSTSNGYSFIHSRSTMIGGLERLKYKLCKDQEQ